MNIFVPQNVHAEKELKEIANVQNQIVSPSTSKPIILLKQDGLIGTHNLLHSGIEIDWRSAMRMLATLELDQVVLEKDRTYTGVEIFSKILPKGFYHVIPGLRIEDGVIVEMKPNNKALPNDIVQTIFNQFGPDVGRRYLDNAQVLANNYNLFRGFTIGVGDIISSREIMQEINKCIETKKMEMTHFVTEVENHPNILNSDLFERTLMGTIGVVRDEVGKLILNNMSDKNNLKIMVESEARGKLSNIAQMSGCVGECGLEGGLPTKKYKDRPIFYFYRNDDRIQSRSFVNVPFVEGLNLPQFIFHHMSAREGLIDTAIKSVTGDTPIIVMEEGQLVHRNIGDWIDEKLAANSEKVEHYVEREMELLKITTKCQIPTTDEDGNVSWGDITAITRHDPGKELYEIRTRGGRQVIVTESKSLLIWYPDQEKFLHTSTPEVKVGDFVPVTHNLASLPYTENTDVDSLQFWNLRLRGSISQTLESCGRTLGAYFRKAETLPPALFKSPVELIRGFFEGLRDSQNGRLFSYESESEKLIDKLILLANLVDLSVEKIHLDGKYACHVNKEFGKTKNDVVLDEIIEINKIDVTKYPKVYDLTVPSTLNFGLANGLHVVDTAESGYVQRKFIKATEDIRVEYDGTVRSSHGKIVQFVYGDNGCDQAKQVKQKINLINYGNATIEKEYGFTKDELKGLKFTAKDNDEYLDYITRKRDKLRSISRASDIEQKTVNVQFPLPVNFEKVITSTRYLKPNTKTRLEPAYVLEQLQEVLKHSNTFLICMSAKDAANKNSLKNNAEKKSKFMFRIALHYFMAPKRCIVEYGLSKEQFDIAISEIIKDFNHAIVQPGENVGIIAAQSLGEPLTQMTLNTFHHTGIASMGAATRGVPRVKELITVSKKIKSPSMYIFFEEEVRKDKAKLDKIRTYMDYTSIKDLAQKVEVFFDPDPNQNIGITDGVSKKFAYESKKGPSHLPWVLRISLDKYRLYTKNVSLLEIKHNLSNYWEEKKQDIKGLNKQDRAIVEKVLYFSITSTYDNEEKAYIHIRFDLSQYDFNLITGLQELILDRVRLKGIADITNVSEVTEKRFVHFDPKTGEELTETENTITTEGINLDQIRYINGIDLNRTICNDIEQVYQHFGIEAARNVLFRELKSVYNDGGVNNVNFHNFAVLIDIMTNLGKFTSLERHSLSKLDTSPLGRASFEKTIEILINAATFNEVDDMNSVVARIMTGQCIKTGTGAFNTVVDFDKILHSEYFTDYAKRNVITVEKDSLIQDVLRKNIHFDDLFIPKD